MKVSFHLFSGINKMPWNRPGRKSNKANLLANR